MLLRSICTPTLWDPDVRMARWHLRYSRQAYEGRRSAYLESGVEDDHTKWWFPPEWRARRPHMPPRAAWTSALSARWLSGMRMEYTGSRRRVASALPSPCRFIVGPGKPQVWYWELGDLPRDWTQTLAVWLRVDRLSGLEGHIGVSRQQPTTTTIRSTYGVQSYGRERPWPRMGKQPMQATRRFPRRPSDDSVAGP